MVTSASRTSLIRFGVFELDLNSGDLRKSGIPIRLQPQPFKVLALLTSHAGQLVSKEEIRRYLWGNETFVDVEKGVSFCLKQVRAALSDNAKTPRFIETLPRRGYRFIAPVERYWPMERHKLLEKEPTGEIVLAVLPFGNIGADPEQEYFADGMTEALMTELAHISAIRVISRTSVMQYKGVKRSLPEIARDLKVDAVVEGAVQRSGRRVRIAAQLIDAVTDTHIWAGSYERELRDILSLQSEVARAIASEIKVKLTPEEHERLTSARVVNPEAYEAYLKGRYCWNKRTQAELKKAIEYFNQAIQIDPYYAQAYAGLADAYSTLGFYEAGTAPPREAFAKAKAAAATALEIDDALAEAQTSLALVKWVYDWNWLDADQHFKRATLLNPNYSTARHWYSLCLAAMGELEDAIAEIRRARALDPLSVSISTSVALCYYWARQYDQAIEQARRTLELNPSYMMAHTVLGLAHEQKEMFAEAIAELQRAVGVSRRSPIIIATLGHAYALSGKRGEALKLLDELNALSKRRYVSPYALSLLHAGLGQQEEAIAMLHKAFEERSGFLVYIDVEPRFDSLRSEPALRNLRRRLRLGS